ncbi:hypothetical protein JR065_08030 [Xanthomonas sp. AmX2]|uniref:hypothetical protein n=1 Tax=Xanthomonas sp. TaxID=29446 RepID=UPI00197F9959|nr:hypothetical protein [Xanthomonas sp.]MBN6150284.1 hypothetical protein [Xanthomonas sp.]
MFVEFQPDVFPKERRNTMLTRRAFLHSSSLTLAAMTSLDAFAAKPRIRHCFVEQENFERAPLESAELGFDCLSRLKA